MNRIGVALLAAAAAVLLSGAAQAKAPPGGVELCGASACMHLDSATAEQFWTGTGSSSGFSRAMPGPFYLVRWHWQPQTEESAYFIPGAAAVRWNDGDGHPGGWSALQPSASAVLSRAAAGIEPYAAPTLTRVTVGGRIVRDPQSYFQLLAGKATWTFFTGRWLTVRFESAAPSPWTDGTSIVRLSRTRPYVEIDGWFFRISKATAARARHGLSLRG
jgi:hypothetical protein